jgi:hypothetical protein
LTSAKEELSLLRLDSSRGRKESVAIGALFYKGNLKNIRQRPKYLKQKEEGKKRKI